jgi:ribokinase
MMAHPYIAVFGTFVMDQVAAVKRFPEAGETVIGESLRLAPGGKGINQAVASARLGAPTAMLGELGQDAYGQRFLAIMDEAKIDHQGVLIDPHKPTGCSQIQLDAHHENRIVVIPGANHSFGLPEGTDAVALVKGSALFIIQFEMLHNVSFYLLRKAKEAGVKTVVNPAPAEKIAEDLYAQIDYLTPNEHELSLLSGLPTGTLTEVKKAALALFGKGVGHVVVTLGGRGALIADQDGVRYVPGYAVKAVDTVGAGDGFNGALAAALLEGKKLNEAVSFANAEGALSVTKEGAIDSYPSRAQLEAFIKERGFPAIQPL